MSDLVTDINTATDKLLQKMKFIKEVTEITDIKQQVRVFYIDDNNLVTCAADYIALLNTLSGATGSSISLGSSTSPGSSTSTSLDSSTSQFLQKGKELTYTDKSSNAYKCIITNVNDNGTYNIKYDAGNIGNYDTIVENVDEFRLIPTSANAPTKASVSTNASTKAPTNAPTSTAVSANAQTSTNNRNDLSIEEAANKQIRSKYDKLDILLKNKKQYVKLSTIDKPNLNKGIPNAHNTCYFNAAIQMLYHIPVLRNHILTLDLSDVNTPQQKDLNSFKEEYSTAFIAYKFAQESAPTNSNTDDPAAQVQQQIGKENWANLDDKYKNITNPFYAKAIQLLFYEVAKGETNISTDISTENLKKISCLEAGEQEDTTEFIEKCIFGNDYLKLDSIKNVFDVKMLNGTPLKIVKIQSDYFTMSISDAIQLHIEGDTETLEIPRESGDTTLAYKLNIPDTNRFIIVALNRFDNYSEKITDSIELGELNPIFDNKRYKLSGYIYHSGGLGGGHYIYVWRNANNEWVTFDDGDVSNPSKSQTNINFGYVYLYERVIEKK